MSDGDIDEPGFVPWASIADSVRRSISASIMLMTTSVNARRRAASEGSHDVTMEAAPHEHRE